MPGVPQLRHQVPPEAARAAGDQYVHRSSVPRSGPAAHGPAGQVAAIASSLRAAEEELDGPGVDSDAGVHRRTYRRVFARLGLDDALAESLYAVESDPFRNAFATDVPETLRALRAGGLRLAVVSDVHVDIRPAFAAAGLDGCVDVFTLSFEQGLQKPDPRMFTRTLDALGVRAAEAVMVGDRSRPDGAAVDAGVPTLLLPPLTGPGDRRLHLVTALCGVQPSSQL
ncbi:HAD family hydrolase [Blastococcus sp. SYSU DS0619]